MTEPIYHFVKDKGWIPATYETLTRNFGNIEVTLTHRRPNPGERFWVDSVDINETMDSMRGYWLEIMRKGYKVGGICDRDFAMRYPCDDDGKRHDSTDEHICVLSYRIL